MGEILKGEFELERSLGRGATAQVHLARPLSSPSDSAERVALKVFHPGLWDRDDLRKRVISEFNTVSALQHPHIVKVLKAYWDWDPPVVAMEYISGESLETFQTRLPYVLPEVSVLVLIDVLKALEYAHEKGVIHRDLKPANIIIETSPQGTRAVVTDFGLAKATDMSRLTLSGTILGSPDFMAPEQARGDVTSPASDLFSVAAIGYFLMTGTRPFTRHSPLATLAAVCEASAELPTRRNPKLSAELSALIMRGLSKDLCARFQSAREFREALEVYLNKIGLSSETFSLSQYTRSPNETAMEAMKAISVSLVDRASVLLQQNDWDACLASLSHLSLVAPESAALERLMNELEAVRELERRKKKRIPLIITGITACALLTGAWIWKTRNTTTEPENKVASLEVNRKPETVSSHPSETELTSLKMQSAAPVRPRPVKPLGRVSFDIPDDIQVYWDGRHIPSLKAFKTSSVGKHKIRFEKPGFAPIEQDIEVNPDEPTVIRVR